MFNNNEKIGKLGEKIACGYLVKKGYKIVDRNYKRKFGEIDVIAKSKEGTLVFCEVKTIREMGNPFDWIAPEDNATAHKLRKMRRVAQFFAAKNQDLIREDKGWRIDLLAIVLSSNETIIRRIKHYENCA